MTVEPLDYNSVSPLSTRARLYVESTILAGAKQKGLAKLLCVTLHRYSIYTYIQIYKNI